MKKIAIIFLIILLIFSLKSVRAESDPSVHNHIITVLSEIKNSKDYDFVKKHLTDKNDEFKIASIYVLISLDKKTASSDLKNIYADSSYEVKRNIIYAIGKIGSAENIDFLAERLTAFEKTDINNEAINALVKIDGEGVIRPLINYMNQFPGNGYILKQMPLLGVKIIEPLFLNLPDGNENVGEGTKKILQGVIDKNANDALRVILKLSASGVDPVNRMAKELINERKEESLIPSVELFKEASGRLEEEIIRFLSSHPDGYAVAGNLNRIWKELQDDDKKIEVIDIICNLKIDPVKDFLLCNVISPSEKVRNHVLSKMKPKEYFANEIIKRLTETEDEIIRSYYKDAVVNLGGGNFSMLLSLFADEKFSNDAEEIIIKLNDKKVDKNLLDNLVNKEKGIDPYREKIRNILVKRAPLSIDTLIEGLKDRNKTEECKKILLTIGKEAVSRLINVLKEDTDDLQTALASEILSEMGESTAPDLIKELGVDDLWGRMNIADVLIKFKQKDAIPALISVLQADDLGLQYRAVYGLRDLGAGTVLKEKLSSVGNEKIKKEIEKILKKIGE